MMLNEIKVRCVYQATLNIEFRPDEIRKVNVMVKVRGSLSDVVEVTLLCDPTDSVYYLNPNQINPLG